MKVLDTKLSRQKAINTITSQIECLNEAITTIPYAKGLNPLRVIVEEKQDILGELNKTHEFTYNFIGGGWNTEYAHTKEEAIEKAIARWGDSPKSKIDTKSFRISTEGEMKMLLMSFY
jgi:hypothetical protein